MPRCAAFLRAINVGGHVVTMVRLRRLFTDMGFADAETFIQTGNVVFTPPRGSLAAVERSVERSLEAALGYPVTTFIRTIPDLVEIAHRTPFGAAAQRPGASTYVALVKKALAPEVTRRVVALAAGDERFAFEGREVHWLRPDANAKTLFGSGLLEKTLGMQATVRNMSTVRNMAAKYGAAT